MRGRSRRVGAARRRIRAGACQPHPEPSPTRSSRPRIRTVRSLRVLSSVVGAQGSDMMSADGHPAVERVVRILEDRLYPATELHQLLPPQVNGSIPSKATVPESGRSSSINRLAGVDFPAAGLPHQSKRLTARQIEADAVQCAESVVGALAAMGHPERLGQVPDFEQLC